MLLILERFCRIKIVLQNLHDRSQSVAHDASIVVFLHGFEIFFPNHRPHPWPSQSHHQPQILCSPMIQICCCFVHFASFAHFRMYLDCRVDIMAVACQLTTPKRLQLWRTSLWHMKTEKVEISACLPVQCRTAGKTRMHSTRIQTNRHFSLVTGFGRGASRSCKKASRNYCGSSVILSSGWKISVPRAGT